MFCISDRRAFSPLCKGLTENPNLKVTTITERGAEWINITTPAYCWYTNDISFKNVYGALYNWYAVDQGNLCPVGWHVPSFSDWTTLISYLGGYLYAGGELKESGSTHWCNGNPGNNSSSFTALPGGYRYWSDGNFSYMTWGGDWWTSTIENSTKAWLFGMSCYSTGCISELNFKQIGLSVRCIKD